MKEITLTELYEIMYDNMRPYGWWPGRSNWEIIWSTVLIQNANWKNASKASESLYRATKSMPETILTLPDEELEKVIASAGFYTRKAKTIKNIAQYFIEKYNCNLELAQTQDKGKLRKEILSIHGVGSETADVILMYGLEKGEFVVDKYARRLFSCLGWDDVPPYEKAKRLIEANLDNFTLRNYQNFHAMIDEFNIQYKLPTQFDETFLKEYQLIIPQ